VLFPLEGGRGSGSGRKREVLIFYLSFLGRGGFFLMESLLLLPAKIEGVVERGPGDACEERRLCLEGFPGL